MRKPGKLQRIFLSVFLGFVFPPILVALWGGRVRHFVIVLVVYLLLVALARQFSALSLILAAYFILEYRAEKPSIPQKEEDI